MLISLDTGLKIDTIPHKKMFDWWLDRLPVSAYAAITAELKSKIEGTEVQTSSWMPGADWTDTVYAPIYEIACSQNPIHSAQFFGLIVWDIFRRDDDLWSFGRYKKDDIPINGLTYFKLQR